MATLSPPPSVKTLLPNPSSWLNFVTHSGMSGSITSRIILSQRRTSTPLSRMCHASLDYLTWGKKIHMVHSPHSFGYSRLGPKVRSIRGSSLISGLPLWPAGRPEIRTIRSSGDRLRHVSTEVGHMPGRLADFVPSGQTMILSSDSERSLRVTWTGCKSLAVSSYLSLRKF